MVLRNLFLVALLAAAASLILIKYASGSPGDETLDLSSLSDADLKATTIRFERVGCYGTCPAYTVTIHGDGWVGYDGKNHVREKGTREGRVELLAIRTLMSQFARAKFLSLPEEYSERKCTSRICTDMATTITELSVKGTSHRVSHYYGCGGAPKELFDLESAIDESVHTDRWTGDVSKQGPFGTTCFGPR